MTKPSVRYKRPDWVLIITYVFLVLFGWINIYASVYNEEVFSIFDFSKRFGMQLIWIGASFLMALFILYIISPKVYTVFPWFFYIGILLLLFLVLIVGKEVNGSKSWFSFGAFSIQPAELSKITTSLCLALIMSKHGFRFDRREDILTTAAMILLPVLLILLEPETGTIIVYSGFLFVLYREGLSGWILLYGLLLITLFITTLKFSPFVSVMILTVSIGAVTAILSKKTSRNLGILIVCCTAFAFIPKLSELELNIPLLSKPEYLLIILTIPIALYLFYLSGRNRKRYLRYTSIAFITSIILIFSVEIVFEKVLKDYQKSRIENLLGITEDLQGAGYNVNQSKIAIGSGGFSGKGFLNGTQTKFNFVPEQTTDFIFCTVGEEWGFLGSLFVIVVFMIMIVRILTLAEKKRDAFARIYGYCVASLLFMHVAINIGMTIGLFPVIGIPLPFLSYGGSSLLTFTALLFIFIRLDMER